MSDGTLARAPGTATCDCCDGRAAAAPPPIWNRPGLSTLAYRSGTYATFRQQLLARLSAADYPALAALRVRSDADFTIALLDAWATAADVLTFYQERLANESYLRTAAERISLLYLARLIGYELRPGRAADVDLAFTVDTSPTAPALVPVPAGTRVQSIPGPNEQPQTFETVGLITAHVEWNAIRPRVTQPQTLSKDAGSVTLAGTTTGLKAGDSVLIRAADGARLRRVTGVTVDTKAETTQAALVENPPVPVFTPVHFPVGVFVNTPLFLDAHAVTGQILSSHWSGSNLFAFTAIQRWPAYTLMQAARAQQGPPPPPPGDGVYAMRVRASVFGYNAPAWNELPHADPHPTLVDGRHLSDDADSAGHVYLDQAYPSVLAGTDSLVALQRPAAGGTHEEIYQVTEVAEQGRSAYGISSRSTRLTLFTADATNHFGDFGIRETTVFAGAESLPPADLPIVDDVQGSVLPLDGLYLGLVVGQRAGITGERTDLPGVTASEIATIGEVASDGGYTVLTFTRDLLYRYKRTTVTVNANLAPATHGETVHEVLGSGDGSQAYQRFTLRSTPLTYVGATTPSGLASTLEVRVNDVLWHEVPTLYDAGPADRVYVTRRADDGTTTVQFGDGRTGARLPSGRDNVKATYRKGSGAAGLVQAGQLTLLLTRPLGVRDVNDPVAPTGGDDPESRDDARANAPLTVRTLDRVVSLQDYEDFARAYSGIAKARATWTRAGQAHGIFLTVAGPDGAAVPEFERGLHRPAGRPARRGRPLCAGAGGNLSPGLLPRDRGADGRSRLRPRAGDGGCRRRPGRRVRVRRPRVRRPRAAQSGLGRDAGRGGRGRG